MSQKMSPYYPDWTPSQGEYWTSLNASLHEYMTTVKNQLGKTYESSQRLVQLLQMDSWVNIKF